MPNEGQQDIAPNETGDQATRQGNPDRRQARRNRTDREAEQPFAPRSMGSQPIQRHMPSHSAPIEMPTPSRPTGDRVTDFLRERQETGRSPIRARIVGITLDESTYGVLVRIDEILRWRNELKNDTAVLDRIEQVFVDRFRSIVD